ncbi:MAG: hypothetical protein NTZ01_02275 [Verrucomicrobia bacterium]|nr:hypothetical protein [Verrucomicrobiota bacterium]
MSYEHHRQPVAPKHVFFKRLLKHFGLALLLMSFTLTLGVLGYHHIGRLSWANAIVESAMLMGGMGPVYGPELHSTAAKLFSAGYALFCGLVLIALFGIVLAPVFHRILHRLHVSEK